MYFCPNVQMASFVSEVDCSLWPCVAIDSYFHTKILGYVLFELSNTCTYLVGLNEHRCHIHEAGLALIAPHEEHRGIFSIHFQLDVAQYFQGVPVLEHMVLDDPFGVAIGQFGLIDSDGCRVLGGMHPTKQMRMSIVTINFNIH